jgi:hypothetical protein
MGSHFGPRSWARRAQSVVPATPKFDGGWAVLLNGATAGRRRRHVSGRVPAFSQAGREAFLSMHREYTTQGDNWQRAMEHHGPSLAPHPLPIVHPIPPTVITIAEPLHRQSQFASRPKLSARGYPRCPSLLAVEKKASILPFFPFFFLFLYPHTVTVAPETGAPAPVSMAQAPVTGANVVSRPQSLVPTHQLNPAHWCPRVSLPPPAPFPHSPVPCFPISPIPYFPPRLRPSSMVYRPSSTCARMGIVVPPNSPLPASPLPHLAELCQVLRAE